MASRRGLSAVAATTTGTATSAEAAPAHVASWLCARITAWRALALRTVELDARHMRRMSVRSADHWRVMPGSKSLAAELTHVAGDVPDSAIQSQEGFRAQTK